MKNVDFFEEHFMGIFSFIFFVFVITFFVILLIQSSKTDMFDLEERCFVFYKKNNYVLEECYRYEEKLRK